jgi:CCR4-NOT transcriptional complex subunit CAF120
MPTPQTVQQPPTPSSQALAQGQGQVNQPSWQREFNNIVDLIGAQPNKHYVASPPELEMILARTSAGALPK